MAEVAAAAIITAGTIFGASKASKASSEAQRIRQSAESEALRFEREKEEQRRREYEQQQAKLDAYYQAEQARLAPRRMAASGVLAKYGYGPISVSPVRPPDWQPGMSSPSYPRGMVDFSGLALGRDQPPDVAPPVPLGGYGGYA